MFLGLRWHVYIHRQLTRFIDQPQGYPFLRKLLALVMAPVSPSEKLISELADHTTNKCSVAPDPALPGCCTPRQHIDVDAREYRGPDIGDTASKASRHSLCNDKSHLYQERKCKTCASREPDGRCDPCAGYPWSSSRRRGTRCVNARC